MMGSLSMHSQQTSSKVVQNQRNGSSFLAPIKLSSRAKLTHQTSSQRRQTQISAGPTANPEISLKDLRKGPKIGSGSFGDVYEALWNNDGQEEMVVLKQYRSVRGRDVASFYQDELKACRRMSSCPGVAPFLGVAGADVYLVWEYQGSVTLQTLLEKGGGTKGLAEVFGIDDEGEAWTVFASGLIEAVKSMHDMGVVHRDVKPGNILLAQTEEGVQVRLVDLGGVADLKKGVRDDEAIFDPVYGAPEQFVITSGLFGGSKIEATGVAPDYKLDAYSIGLVLLQLAVPALYKENAMKNMRNAVNKLGSVEEWAVSDGAQVACDFALLEDDGGKAWDLISKLTDEDPSSRISVKQAGNDKLFGSSSKKSSGKKGKKASFWPFG